MNAKFVIFIVEAVIVENSALFPAIASVKIVFVVSRVSNMATSPVRVEVAKSGMLAVLAVREEIEAVEAVIVDVKT